MTFARIHKLRMTPEQHDEGLRLVVDDMLPWLRDSNGFRGLVRLAASADDTVLVLSLWATEQDMRDSSEAVKQFGALAIASSGAQLLSVDEYEVTFFDVDPAAVSRGARPS
jgi:heme-degrading monooxygenase HmoA